MAFNAKNLTYESREPTFLRKLKSEYGGSNADRHASQLARPRKQKDNDDDDDEPTYVDEESNDSITRAQYEAILKKQEQITLKTEQTETLKSNIAGAVAPYAAKDVASETLSRKELVAVIGGIGKRRLAKVIGDDDLDHNGEERSEGTRVVARSTKKSKKIKLSFDDEGTDSH